MYASSFGRSIAVTCRTGSADEELLVPWVTTRPKGECSNGPTRRWDLHHLADIRAEYRERIAERPAGSRAPADEVLGPHFGRDCHRPPLAVATWKMPAALSNFSRSTTNGGACRSRHSDSAATERPSRGRYGCSTCGAIAASAGSGAAPASKRWSPRARQVDNRDIVANAVGDIEKATSRSATAALARTRRQFLHTLSDAVSITDTVSLHEFAHTIAAVSRQRNALGVLATLTRRTTAPRPHPLPRPRWFLART